MDNICNIKLVALDMDGTSYTRMSTIVDENIEPIRKAVKQGVNVCFITGRPVFAEQNALEENGFTDGHSIIAACNGAAIYDFGSKKLIEENSIPSDIVEKAFNIIKEHKDVDAWAYSNNFEDVILTDNGKNSELYKVEKQFFEGNFIERKDVKDFPDCFKLLVSPFSEELKLELRNIGLEVAWTPGSFAAEVNATHINKGFALEFLADYFDVDLINVMAMGDGANDIPMLKKAGFPVAPANAVEEVKSICRYVTEVPVEGAAVKEALEKFVIRK